MPTEIEKVSVVEHIKQTIRWFPGVILGLKRQVGKTTALLQVIHDEYQGAAIYYAPSPFQREYAQWRYRGMYPDAVEPIFVCEVDETKGHNAPILVDEWWFVLKPEQRKLIATGRVVARIGTEF